MDTMIENIAPGESIPEFKTYRNWLVHDWSKVLTFLVITLVPLFYVLDYFIVDKNLHSIFALYRIIPIGIAVIQYLVIKKTNPGTLSYTHGYIISFFVGGAISLMTVDLGGFDSRYYAGLCLVMIGVTILLPWGLYHSAANCLLIEIMYLVVNFIWPQPFVTKNLISNLFFMNATAIIAVSVNHVRFRLIEQEFTLRSLVKSARDALWGEMQIAKKIQTSLLPNISRVGSYRIAAQMLPAKEVGGDYYDVIQSKYGENWIAIGDVSGHGVESGLIMMMTQTSIFSLLNNNAGYKPSRLIDNVNSVIRKNIHKLGLNNYMTILAMKLDENSITVAGKHQDIIQYKSRTKKIEKISTQGTWIGLAENIEKYLINMEISVDPGDLILLFTDGATEAADMDNNMFGDDRLVNLLQTYADLSPEEIIMNLMEQVTNYQTSIEDDITFMIIKKDGQ